MATIAVPAVVGTAAAVGSQWTQPTTFASRHESTYHTETAEIDNQIDNWHTIPIEDVPSDGEQQFNDLRDKARTSADAYHDSIERYKEFSWFHSALIKWRLRQVVRRAKRNYVRSARKLRSHVQTQRDRSRANSRESSRANSRDSCDSASTLATTESPPNQNLRTEFIEEWRQSTTGPATDPMKPPSSTLLDWLYFTNWVQKEQAKGSRKLDVTKLTNKAVDAYDALRARGFLFSTGGSRNEILAFIGRHPQHDEGFACLIFLHRLLEDPRFSQEIFGDETDAAKQAVLAGMKWLVMTDGERKPYYVGSKYEKHKLQSRVFAAHRRKLAALLVVLDNLLGGP